MHAGSTRVIPTGTSQALQERPMRRPLQVTAYSLVGDLTSLSTPTRGALCCQRSAESSMLEASQGERDYFLCLLCTLLPYTQDSNCEKAHTAGYAQFSTSLSTPQAPVTDQGAGALPASCMEAAPPTVAALAVLVTPSASTASCMSSAVMQYTKSASSCR